MSAQRVPSVGDTVAEKYLLESVIGQGGMGAVFRARHLLTDRKVALKWMLPDLEAGDAGVQRFLREARAMGRIDHPSVVGVLDVGVEGRAAFLVMELLRGTSLRELMIEGRGMPAERAIALLMPALEGVAAAHSAGVVHRDLKPENLFVVTDDRGEPAITKVLDFGVSKLRDDRAVPGGSPGSGSITRTGAMVGTPAYMAPEQVRGIKEIDARTDVWAIGAILYEMVVGDLPFRAETVGGTLIAIATEAEPRIETRVEALPVGFADVLHRALEKSPNDRYDDIGSFARALEPFAPGMRYRPPRPASNRPPPMSEATTSSEDRARPSGASRVETMIRGSSDAALDVHVSVVKGGEPSASVEPRASHAPPQRRASQPDPASSPSITPWQSGVVPGLAPASRSWRWAVLGVVVLGVVALGALAIGGVSSDGAGQSQGSDAAAEAARDPVVAEPARDPVVAEPVVAEPVAIDPVAADPLAADPVAVDPPSHALPAVDPASSRPRPRARRSEPPASAAATEVPAAPVPAEGGPRGRTGTISREDF